MGVPNPCPTSICSRFWGQNCVPGTKIATTQGKNAWRSLFLCRSALSVTNHVDASCLDAVDGGWAVNKSELIDAITERLGDKKAAAAAVEAVVDTIVRAVAKGEKVAIAGFGVFEKQVRNARMARNPATGAPVRIKKTAVPKFRPGAGFKEVVSGAKKLAPAPKTVAVKAVRAPVAKKAAPAKAAAKAPA